MIIDSNSYIESKSQLIEYFSEGCKPKNQWKIGIEHEKFLYNLNDTTPVAYDSLDKVPTIKKFLEALLPYGWRPFYENGLIIALSRDEWTITLEPGGQFELSTPTFSNLHEMNSAIDREQKILEKIGRSLGIGMFSLGFQPRWDLSEIPMMPKERYTIMKNYMPRRGNLGLDMMFRTCTLQVCLDFSSEEDMIKKFRVSLALQPLITALFSNSPFVKDRPSGFLSYRSNVWTDVDSDRCGILPFVFSSKMGFEEYVDYAVDIPMYFVYRNGIYTTVEGQTFRDFLNGKVTKFKGEKPILSDWINHLTTIFPEVRLKNYLELRGADSGPWNEYCSLPALWVGLLYDDTSLSAAWDIVKKWSLEEINYARISASKYGLNAKIGKLLIKELLIQLLKISDEGLVNRHYLNKNGDKENIILYSLIEILRSGKTRADILLDLYYSQWNKTLQPLFINNKENILETEYY